MGASRMGFDLLTAQGRENLGFVWKHRRAGYRLDWKLVFEDTLMPLVCRVGGHLIYDANRGGTPDYACWRCHTYQKAPPDGELYVLDMYNKLHRAAPASPSVPPEAP